LLIGSIDVVDHARPSQWNDPLSNGAVARH